jgi:hypothetical protein
VKPSQFLPTLAAVILLASCGSAVTSSSSTPSPTANWKNILGASLEITQAIPGPSGDIKYEYAGQNLDNLIGLMNRYDISVVPSYGDTNGCTGGRNYDLVLHPQGASTVEMMYYSCGGTGSGTMGGDVNDFTNAVVNSPHS